MRSQWLPSRLDAPGLALAFGIGAAAVALARVLPPSPYVSDVMLALFFGALVVNTPLAAILGVGARGKEREPDRYAAGLRYVGKWVLRLAIILMGLKVQTSFFGRGELVVIFGVAASSLPSAFLFAHVLGVVLRVRRPLVDLLAGGTMICGASAVNAIAPVVGAHREEQGVAIAVMFLFSVVAMITFRAAAALLGLDPSYAGLWSGLAVNDLSSAVAVGAQMGGAGGVMAAASKSARILLLAPVLVALALARREAPVKTSASASADVKTEETGLGARIVEALPGFLLGYVGLAVARALGDRAFADAPLWRGVLDADKLAVDVLMGAVSAGIGLHLSLRTILGSSARAVAVGGGASIWTALVTLAMIAAAARGAPVTAVAIGAGALALSAVLHRAVARDGVALVRRRFDEGELVTLAEATKLLDAVEREAPFDDRFLRRILDQLSPSIGELIPARTSPLPHGEGCRWVTYWEGRSGWALVAVVREPGSMTPIHAHPHRMLGKAIEGTLEELRFREIDAATVELVSREVLGHERLVETDGLATFHVVRAHGEAPAIDLQLRGPEVGKPGRRLALVDRSLVDLAAASVGARIAVREEIDDRPGHGGEGASVGRIDDRA
ncbi:MAG: putative sulfate exporter family transporter [Labilithrix sp.]|nr:putative sulfate exporter family transporter [Labilithrix sp.]